MRKPAAPGQASAPSLDTALVRELAAVLDDTGLSEIEVERGGLRIRVVRTLTGGPAAVVAAPPAPISAGPTAAAPAPPSPAAGEIVKSPMVGSVYLQAQPGAEPFARVGDTVAEGQTLLLIEAMKTMNPIGAPRAGTVLEFLVVDGQPVEYGEPLVVIG